MEKEQINPDSHEKKQEITIFEFKKWLDNTVNDAELKLPELEKEEIVFALDEKVLEILLEKLSKLEKTEKTKINQEIKGQPLLEFKRWLDNCVNDAKVRGLSKDDIILALKEKSHSVFVQNVISRPR